MRRPSFLLALVVLVSALFSPLRDAHAHAIYNLGGYGSGIGGSTNGADGDIATPIWTNGPLPTDDPYTGSLPVNWYAGLHSRTQVRTIQTGSGANPPSGSLLQQVLAYNAANDPNDPDLPTDAVIAPGGLSWTDPSNDNQGWGHGLDYGLIHVSVLDEIQADGPVKLTITLTDDPTDNVAVQLAYALYSGWDTSSTSVRHQAFITSPSPVDNPLGSAGLTLIDYAVAPPSSTAGRPPTATLSRTYDAGLNPEGKYTIFVAAQPQNGVGVAGQYQLTAGLFPVGAINEQLTACTTALASANTSIATMTADADDDTVPDQRDACGDTPAGQFVDAAGCSQAQFCAGVAVATKAGRKACKKADWKNDEPSMRRKQSDCTFAKRTRTCDATP
jgi:hypothetical protein